jgi:DNA polymerase-4
VPCRSLIVDFNSYFASVEQQERPELRGRAVAVAPMLAETTCCIAASYVAKRQGVKTGTPVHEARQLCPGLIVLEARPAVYVRYHQKLVEAIERCIHVVDVMSIDEVCCDLTETFAPRDKAEAVAKKIKRTIAREVGECLTSSIGIAPNPFLAKIASDMQKPDGLVILDDADLPNRLFELKLRDLPGVGASMERRLLAAGYDTVEKLCAASRADLHKVWRGIEGDRMYHGLRGEIVYRPATQTSTIGHSHVLPPELRNEPGALATLHRLLQKAAMRLRHAGYYAGGLHVSMRYPRRASWSEAMTFLETQDTLELTHVFNQLWGQRPTARQPMAVGVTLFNFTPVKGHTRTLFETGDSRASLNAAIDKLNRRLGKNTVYYGGAHGSLDYAPLRIAFTRIPDVALEEGETCDDLLPSEAELAKFRPPAESLE